MLRYRPAVALRALADAALARRLAQVNPPDVSIVETLQTENLGIERIVANVTANPDIRFLVLCGADSQGKVGHLPGQCPLSLARNGIAAEGRIIGAQGRRPRIENLWGDHVAHLRRNVELIDRAGERDPKAILRPAEVCASRDPGPPPGQGVNRNGMPFPRGRILRGGTDKALDGRVYMDRRDRPTPMPDAAGRDLRPEEAEWAGVRREALLRVASRILRDEHQAEDVVQETLAKVWERRAALAPKCLAAYLARAVELNALKRRARLRRGLPLGERGDVAGPESAQEDPFEVDAHELEEALAGLPASQQTVIRMRYYMGLTFREIAAVLAVSQNTVASRCRYALASLRETLTGSRKRQSNDSHRR